MPTLQGLGISSRQTPAQQLSNLMKTKIGTRGLSHRECHTFPDATLKLRHHVTPRLRRREPFASRVLFGEQGRETRDERHEAPARPRSTAAAGRSFRVSRPPAASKGVRHETRDMKRQPALDQLRQRGDPFASRVSRLVSSAVSKGVRHETRDMKHQPALDQLRQRRGDPFASHVSRLVSFCGEQGRETRDERHEAPALAQPQRAA